MKLEKFISIKNTSSKQQIAMLFLVITDTILTVEHLKTVENTNVYEIIFKNNKHEYKYKFYKLGDPKCTSDPFFYILSDIFVNDYSFNEYCIEFGCDPSCLLSVKEYYNALDVNQEFKKLFTEKELKLLNVIY